MQAGTGYALLQNKLDAATAEIGVLNAQAKRAVGQAGLYKKEALAVAVQSYKRGSTGLVLFATMTALGSPESLSGVQMLQLMGGQAAMEHTQASESQATATVLEKNRQAAQTAQSRLTAAALRRRDSAVAAQSAVTEQLQRKCGVQPKAINSLLLPTLCQTQPFPTRRQNWSSRTRRQNRSSQWNPRLPWSRAPGPGDCYIPVEDLLPNIPGVAVNDPPEQKPMRRRGWLPAAGLKDSSGA